MNESNDKDTEAQSVLLTELEAYRKSKGMSVQEIADSIKVNREIVQKIEGQKFANIGARTFVKGHLTNYCKYLGLDPKPLLQQLPAEYHSSPNLVIPDALMPKPMSRVRRHSNSIGRYMVGTFLLATLATTVWFIWDKWKVQPQAIDINSIGVGSGLAAANNTNDADERNQTDAEDNQQLIYSSLLPQASAQNKPASSTVDTSEVDTSVEDETITPMIVLPSSEADNTNTEETDTEADTAGSENQVYQIELSLPQASWVAIKEANGGNIEYNMIEAGSYSYESGDDKLHFRIGNAIGAQIRINNEVIDLTPFLRQNIADFNWPLDSAEG
ncbi:helix-turn-helix domain-containing protein [Marinicella sp. W31]|uniref:helix-turn-helix domain-containing protein n=1 Tax=Marinicella sp. W31 TaxID=3023713 RepID=UPI0037563B04